MTKETTTKIASLFDFIEYCDYKNYPCNDFKLYYMKNFFKDEFEIYLMRKEISSQTVFGYPILPYVFSVECCSCGGAMAEKYIFTEELTPEQFENLKEELSQKYGKYDEIKNFTNGVTIVWRVESDLYALNSKEFTKILYKYNMQCIFEALRYFRKYDLVVLPVLDDEKMLVGIVTVDDVMDVMVDETSEDISKMAAVEPHDKSYFETSVFEHAKHRIIWLLVLMFSATLTGSIITRYENAFQAVPLLVSFIPMLMDTGGNCGSQSSTLIIRGIALNEIRFKEIFKVMFKEFRIALVVGVILAIANGLRIYVMYQDINIAFVIALSLIVTVILSKLIGCILPLVANQIGLDPAIMASPLITTIVDTCSILVYFNIAVHIFNL